MDLTEPVENEIRLDMDRNAPVELQTWNRYPVFDTWAVMDLLSGVLYMVEGSRLSEPLSEMEILAWMAK